MIYTDWSSGEPVEKEWAVDTERPAVSETPSTEAGRRLAAIYPYEPTLIDILAIEDEARAAVRERVEAIPTIPGQPDAVRRSLVLSLLAALASPSETVRWSDTIGLPPLPNDEPSPSETERPG